MTPEKVSQRNVQIDASIPNLEIARIREKYLSDDEWWKEGTSIFWTVEAANRVKLALGRGTITPTAKDEQNEEGQPEAEKPEETPLQVSEMPDGEAAQQDVELSSVDSEPVETPQAQAETTLTVRVLKRARNYRYVYASLDGERIPVFCPKKGRQNIVGKNVRVLKTVVDGETKYTLMP